MKRIIILILLSLLIISLIGCASAVFPPTWPRDRKTRGPLEIPNGDPIETSKTVTLVNAVVGSQLTRIGPDRAYMDFHSWTDLIIERLETELIKRGVKVVPSGVHVFKISLSSVVPIPGAALRQCTVDTKVCVEKVDGNWTRTYKCTSKGLGTQCYGPEHTSIASYNSVKAIVTDPAFREALK